MSQVFTARTPGKREWKGIRRAENASRIGRYLHRHVEFLDGTGSGAREWNFMQYRDALARSLEACGLEVLAGHVRACHRDFRGFRCGKHSSHSWAVPAYACHLRLCPFEMKARSLRSRKNVARAVAGLKHPRYVVLSQRNCGLDDLVEGIDSLYAAFARLRKSFFPLYAVKGIFAALEITFNAADRTWHPHLNLILDGSKYIPQAHLLAAWVTATSGNGRGAWIGAVDAGTVNELLKYVTKLIAFVDIPEAVFAFLQATKRRRFLRSYGSLYNVELEKENVETSRFHCPDCGCNVVEDLGFIQRRLVFWDSSGCARFVTDG